MNRNYIKYTNSSFKGYKISDNNIINESDCRELCNNTKNCNSYSQSKNNCSLHSRPINMHLAVNTISGVTDTIDIPYSIGNDSGNDILLLCDNSYVNGLDISQSTNINTTNNSKYISNIQLRCANGKITDLGNDKGYNIKRMNSDSGFRGIVGSSDSNALTGIVSRNTNGTINSKVGYGSLYIQPMSCDLYDKMYGISIASDSKKITRLNGVICKQPNEISQVIPTTTTNQEVILSQEEPKIDTEISEISKIPEIEQIPNIGNNNVIPAVVPTTEIHSQVLEQSAGCILL